MFIAHRLRRRRLIRAALAALCVFAGGARSAEGELDTELMHSIEDANKSLASNIAGKEGRAASSDAKELGEMFAQVEAYFVRKGDAVDAVELAKKSRELSARILQSVSASDFGAASDSATTLSRTCKTCHNYYKKS
jgi:O6-methylguanine-DNA--protein-cysteine methyltransferase